MIYILFFLLFTVSILTNADIGLYYAFHGLTLWYQKMVPALLPFMILSGTLVRMHLTERFVFLVHPIFRRIFRCSPNVTYGILLGFLCGFPMGARLTADLLKQDKLHPDEAKFLLAFNNNIGPVYFCSFIIPLLGIQTQNIPSALFGMYGLPFLYGIFLRYTFYKKELDRITLHSIAADKQSPPGEDLLTALDESIRSGINSISMLCGYMIFFNMLNILPHIFFPKLQPYIAPLLEITGGITLYQDWPKEFILILLPFGGLSCIAQTNSMIRNTGLSLKNYILHKCILTTFTLFFYVPKIL